MGSNGKNHKGVSRRQFVKGVAAGALGSVVAGAAGTALSAPSVSKPWMPAKWDYEADVVILGFGAAGAVSAITAHDAGAKVLILEKAPEEHEGGNSRVSGNLTFSPTDVEKAVVYMRECCGPYKVPEDIIRVWAEEMNKNWDWVKSLGGTPMVSGPTGKAGQSGRSCRERNVS